MKNLNQIKKEIKILGYYQIFGGVFGIGLIATQLFGIGSIILIKILLAPFLFSIYAGSQCLKGRRNLLSISKLNQVLQVISFSLGGIGYTYHSGIFFSFGIENTEEITFNWSLGLSSISFELNSSGETSHTLFNIVAFYLVYRIGKYEDRIEELKELGQNNELNLNEHLIEDN